MYKPLARLLPYTAAAIFLWGILYFTWPSFERFPPPPPPPHAPFRQRGRFPPHGPGRKVSARADAVRHAFLHAYAGYQKYAGNNDELKPVSNGAVNKYVSVSVSVGLVLIPLSFNGWKLTLVDALDTMWIMGLEKEFYDAVTQVAELDFELKEVRR